MDVADMVDGSADGIEQGGAAPDIVLFFGDRANHAHLYPVVKHLVLIVKEDGGDEGITRLLLLLLIMALKPPMVSPSSPCIEPLRSRVKTSYVKLCFIKNPPILYL